MEKLYFDGILELCTDLCWIYPPETGCQSSPGVTGHPGWGACDWHPSGRRRAVMRTGPLSSEASWVIPETQQNEASEKRGPP